MCPFFGEVVTKSQLAYFSLAIGLEGFAMAFFVVRVSVRCGHSGQEKLGCSQAKDVL